MTEINIYRRGFLSVSASIPSVVLAGCADSEPEETSEYSCPDPFPVKTYNKSEEQRSIMLEIRDSSDQVLLSDTIDLEPDTGAYDGSDLDVEIFEDQKYTFEVTGDDGEALSETFQAKCGPVFVFVTQTGELELRDDELDHLRES